MEATGEENNAWRGPSSSNWPGISWQQSFFCVQCTEKVQIADAFVVDYGNLVCVLSINPIWMTTSAVQRRLVFVPVDEIFRERNQDVCVTTSPGSHSKIEHHPHLCGTLDQNDNSIDRKQILNAR